MQLFTLSGLSGIPNNAIIALSGLSGIPNNSDNAR